MQAYATCSGSVLRVDSGGNPGYKQPVSYLRIPVGESFASWADILHEVQLTEPF